MLGYLVAKNILGFLCELANDTLDTPYPPPPPSPVVDKHI